MRSRRASPSPSSSTPWTTTSPPPTTTGCGINQTGAGSMDWQSVLKYNPYHEPAGSRIGGRFASAPSGGQADAGGTAVEVADIAAAEAERLKHNAVIDTYMGRQQKEGLVSAKYGRMSAEEVNASLKEQYPHMGDLGFDAAFDFVPQEVTSQLDRLHDLFTTQFANLRTVVLGDTNDDYLAMHPQTWAIHRGMGIYFNPHYFSVEEADASIIIEHLKEAEEVGFHPPGHDTISSIVTHEFGHMVHALENLSNE